MSNTRFPSGRGDWDAIRREMMNVRSNDLPWRGQRTFKPAYFAGEDVLEVANRAYEMYITDNALYGKSAFPSLDRYENDVLEWVLEMLHAPFGASGSVSTGGTESNFMAVKTARDWARHHRGTSTTPNMIVPRTAHPSFDKAAHMLEVEIRRVPHSVDYRADVTGMAEAIDEHTIMLIASAPPYPYGETDPIEAIATLALGNELWLHVDACLGGFILPFAREFDDSIPDFDFKIEGVFSISADIHKYGYAAKGISALLLRDSELERYQHSSFDNWPSGLYSTANVCGSRSGGALASAWAVMKYLGWEGYREVVKAQIDIRERLIEGINRIDPLFVLAKPQAFNFAFAAEGLDMFAVADGLSEHGWTLARSNEPPSVQLMVNRSHESVVPTFLEALERVVAGVKSGEITARNTKAIYAV